MLFSVTTFLLSAARFFSKQKHIRYTSVQITERKSNVLIYLSYLNVSPSGDPGTAVIPIPAKPLSKMKLSMSETIPKKEKFIIVSLV